LNLNSIVLKKWGNFNLVINVKRFILSLDQKKIIYFSLVISFLYILIYNLFHFDPILGYDAEAHYSYVDTFSRYLPYKVYIPRNFETREFFNPPIAYIFPSVVQVFCRNLIESSNLLKECQPIYGKLAQIFQAIIYCISIFINLKTINLILNKKNYINFSYFILTMLLAVNYKTISMLRGEVYILFFLSILINLFFRMEKKEFNFKLIDIAFFGSIIGLLALSRQWAFLLFPAFFILTFRNPKKFRKKYLYFIFGSFVTGFFLSGWFYINNFIIYGTFTPFNTEKVGLKLDNLTFFDWNSVSTYLFENPIRPYFKNQFFPILYSDLWGDYWGYFVFTSRFLDIGRDQLSIGEYLGRVNFISLFTSGLLIYGIFFQIYNFKKPLVTSYILYSILISLSGFLWFTLAYPTSGSGDTIKATYLVQVFNLCTFITSLFMEEIKNKKIYYFLLSILISIFIYNFDSYLSHFPINYPAY